MNVYRLCWCLASEKAFVQSVFADYQRRPFAGHPWYAVLRLRTLVQGRSSSLQELREMRDGLYQLYEVACEWNYDTESSVFYEAYESVCRQMGAWLVW